MIVWFYIDYSLRDSQSQETIQTLSAFFRVYCTKSGENLVEFEQATEILFLVIASVLDSKVSQLNPLLLRSVKKADQILVNMKSCAAVLHCSLSECNFPSEEVDPLSRLFMFFCSEARDIRPHFREARRALESNMQLFTADFGKVSGTYSILGLPISQADLIKESLNLFFNKDSVVMRDLPGCNRLAALLKNPDGESPKKCDSKVESPIKIKSDERLEGAEVDFDVTRQKAKHLIKKYNESLVIVRLEGKDEKRRFFDEEEEGEEESQESKGQGSLQERGLRGGQKMRNVIGAVKRGVIAEENDEEENEKQ
jgi:hypothetical protein